MQLYRSISPLAVLRTMLNYLNVGRCLSVMCHIVTESVKKNTLVFTL